MGTPRLNYAISFPYVLKYKAITNEIVKTPAEMRTQQTVASSNLTHGVFTHKHFFSGIWRWRRKEVPMSRNRDYLSEGLACITGLASELYEPPGGKWLVSLASHSTTKCKGLLSRRLTFDFIYQLSVWGQVVERVILPWISFEEKFHYIMKCLIWKWCVFQWWDPSLQTWEQEATPKGNAS